MCVCVCVCVCVRVCVYTDATYIQGCQSTVKFTPGDGTHYELQPREGLYDVSVTHTHTHTHTRARVDLSKAPTNRPAQLSAQACTPASMPDWVSCIPCVCVCVCMCVCHRYQCVTQVSTLHTQETLIDVWHL